MPRPLLPIDADKVAELAFGGASNNEIAYILDVDDQTIINRFSKLLNKKRAERRIWLRGLQNNKASRGDSTMMIWLGKNELNQTDRMEQQHSGGVTIKVEYEDVDPNDSIPEATQPSPSDLL